MGVNGFFKGIFRLIEEKEERGKRKGERGKGKGERGKGKGEREK